MINPLLKGRFLFIVDECSRCAVWKSFIDKLNSELEFEKRIQIIDCSEFYEFGIIRNPIFKLFNRYIAGEFPVIFLDGIRKDGTNSVAEADAWLRAMLHDDFIIPQYNAYLWNKDCSFGDRGIFKRRIICR